MNNFWTRTVAGIVFIAVILAGLLIDKWLFAVMILFVTVVMLHEFYSMTMGSRARKSRILAITTGAVLCLLIFIINAGFLPAAYASVAIIPMLCIMVSSLYVKDDDNFRLYSYIYTGLLYIAIPLAVSNYLAFDREGNFNGLLILGFLCIIWGSDVGAYCIGSLFGRKGEKMCPEISPKKSWAGFWGGMAFSVLVSVLLTVFGLFDFPWSHALILAVIMHVAGVYGDLFESRWKRICDVKDSGTIIPGHGGLLDRFDSALFAIPSGALYLLLTGLLPR